MSERIIEVKNLTKKYHTLLATNNISFDVKNGEVFGFLGPNGAGKTTTIKMLTTLLKPTSGTAKIAGFDIIKESAKVREKIILVQQDTSLDAFLTVKENISIFTRLHGISKDEANARTDKQISAFGLEEYRNKMAMNLSGGIKRRIQLARAFACETPSTILFLDEPTVGLDPVSKRDVLNMIRGLNERGTTIFLTTHSMGEAEALCDRTAIINNGEIIELDHIDELKKHFPNSNVEIKIIENSKMDNAKKLIFDISGIESVNIIPNSNSLLALTSYGEDIVPYIIEKLHQNNIKIGGINVNEPTLEDVFLGIMGRSKQ